MILVRAAEVSILCTLFLGILYYKMVTFVVEDLVALPPRAAWHAGLQISLTCHEFQLFLLRDLWRLICVRHFPCVMLYRGLASAFGWKHLVIQHVKAANEPPRVKVCNEHHQSLSGDVMIVMVVRTAREGEWGCKNIMSGCIRFCYDTHENNRDIILCMKHHVSQREMDESLSQAVLDTFAISWTFGNMVHLTSAPVCLPHNESGTSTHKTYSVNLPDQRFVVTSPLPVITLTTSHNELVSEARLYYGTWYGMRIPHALVYAFILDHLEEDLLRS